MTSFIHFATYTEIAGKGIGNQIGPSAASTPLAIQKFLLCPSEDYIANIPPLFINFPRRQIRAHLAQEHPERYDK